MEIVDLDTQQTQEEVGPGKRPWLMDALLYIGNCMAAITHIREKQQYLTAEIEDGGGEIGSRVEKTDEIANLNNLRNEIYDGYNTVMSYIMDNVPGAKKEYRCLLKHTATMLVISMELGDAINNATSDSATNSAFSAFAGAVSLSLGIEFKTCIRCLYDGMKDASDNAKK